MKAMVVYDSVFGNTEKVAQAIGGALGTSDEVQTLRVSDVKPEQLAGLDLLVVGSPTRAFRPTPATTNLLKEIPADSLKSTRVAAFDTRVSPEALEKSAILRFFVGIFGYAAKPIEGRLTRKGGKLAASSQGFIVEDTEGPLREGELERAVAWAKQIVAG